jgi:hypothetical protein
METLIPNIQFKDFTILTTGQLKQLKSCLVFDGEEYLFCFIRPNTEYAKARAEDTAYLSNLVGGMDYNALVSLPVEQEAVIRELYVSDKPQKPKRNKRMRRKVKV